MSYINKDILTLREELDTKKSTAEELFHEAHTLALKSQSTINSFVTILDKMPDNEGKSILSGIPYALKDNISTKDILTTASSNILKDYVPVFNATVYEKLWQAGAKLVGKTVLDELAMGATGTTGHTGIVRNPWDLNRQIGGSSAGSAASVALGIVPFAIGSDTGDSIRKPAAFGGIVGYKPTYGLISRYGLIAFASSLDHVGCFTRSVEDAAIVTNIIKGKDNKDMTSLASEDMDLVKNIKKDINGKKLFYIKEICDRSLYQDPNILEILDQFFKNLEKIKKLGFIVEEVSIDKELLSAIYPSYMTISCAEATSNNANLTGISFGNKQPGKTINDIIFNTRTKGFSELIKRRFVLGSYVLQKENQEKLFLNACRIRHMIVDKINNLFKEYDGLILPTSATIAPLFTDTTDKLSTHYLLLENHLIIGNFGGFPSISLPSGIIKNMPISINITSAPKEDIKLLNMAYKIEEALGYKGLTAGGKHV